MRFGEDRENTGKLQLARPGLAKRSEEPAICEKACRACHILLTSGK